VTIFDTGPAGLDQVPAILTWGRVMTSATLKEMKDASHSEGYWMIVFAVTLLMVVGIFNVIEGIAAIARSHVFIANATYVIGDLRA
jgi:hypothetical protein